MVTSANVLRSAAPAPADAPPLVAIRSTIDVLSASLPSAAIAVCLVDGPSLLCLSSTGEILTEGTYLPAAAIPGLAAAHPGYGVFPFQCTLPAAVGSLESAFALPVFLADRMLGCLLVFAAEPLDARSRGILAGFGEALVPHLNALSAPLPAEPAATQGQGPRSVHFMHDCRSEVSVIYSAVECLERYGAGWDAATWQRYLGKIKASAEKLTVLLDRE